jgi:hypothetical protein
MEKLSEQKIKELEEKFGELIICETDYGTFVFRKPNRSIIKRFFDTVPKSIYDATYTLCIDTVVEPSREELMRIEEQEAGIMMILGAEIQGFFSNLSRVHSRKVSSKTKP